MLKRLGNSATGDEMSVGLAGWSCRLKEIPDWRDALAKIALVVYVTYLWWRGISGFAYVLLILAWVVDGGPRRFGHLIREPLVKAILIFCGVLALGLLWGGYDETADDWLRYFRLLAFIPFLSLLNKERLPWAVGALLAGYGALVLFGAYHTMVVGAQRVPMPFEMHYLRFSLFVGVGVIVVLYFASTVKNKKITALLWMLAVFLLVVHFHQNGRGPLLATVLTAVFLIFMFYRKELKTLVTVTVSFIALVLVLASTSNVFQARWVDDTRHDIESIQQRNYATSIGYRLAIWDVGLHGILESPWFGQGTGEAASYFKKTVTTYKGGIYKDLPQFLELDQYHNDWIEIGMHLGVPGILIFAFLLCCWFQTLREYRLPILAATFLCYVFLAGFTDPFLFKKVSNLMLVLTAVAIVWQREYGLLRASK